ncbi:MAG: photosystem II protein Psb27 [Gloeomargaritaceae cyanobacterium C42_A2020_066]|nr:photosystem II protein Psb27 [Gloeomargaritaceae cyanobacterium C42_A2020_066]
MGRIGLRLVALVLACVVLLSGCSNIPASLTGNYAQDTLALVETLRTAIELPETDPAKSEYQAQAKLQLNDFAARYRRDTTVKGLTSYTTMRTVLNAIAGHYSSYPGRPFPDKLKARITEELNQIEVALNRGN